MGKVSKRAKALDIPKSVKDRVWERDGEHCIICGSCHAAPNAHFIARSQGGLGIEQNIVTLCGDCHREYDNSEKRPVLRIMIRNYLLTKYPGMEEKDNYYRKESQHE